MVRPFSDMGLSQDAIASTRARLIYFLPLSSCPNCNASLEPPSRAVSLHQNTTAGVNTSRMERGPAWELSGTGSDTPRLAAC